MKHIKLYLTALLLASLGITGCDDNFDTPPLTGPEASIKPNTTIAELKAAYWFNATNGVDTVGMTADGHHVVIGGRVVSSDESGNIYKNLVIQDESGAITLSINANSLYNRYRLGQEIVIDATDMYVGKYSGLFQFGMPDYDDQFGWQTAFMPLEFFQEHMQLNGLPQPELIDTVTITLNQLANNSADTLQKYQSQLVRIDNVEWQEAGQTFADYQQSVSRHIVDENGNTLTVRNSGYADFYNSTIPEGKGSVVGILGYYNTDWQLTLRSLDDCMFGSQEGTRNEPLTVAQAIEVQGQAEGWVEGVIVGVVAPGVTSVASNSDIEWAAPFSLPNTLVIADAAETRDYTQCIVVELPQNSDLRELINLADHPQFLGETIKLHGSFEQVLGMAGVAGNAGTTNEFEFSGTITYTSIQEDFDSYGTSISGLLQAGWTSTVVSGDKDWYLREFDGNVYATMSGYNGTNPPFDSWLITPAINIDGATDKVLNFRTQVAPYGNDMIDNLEVYAMTSTDPGTAVLTRLDPVLAKAPSGDQTYSNWANSGNVDLSGLSGTIYIGFRYIAEASANYTTWCIDDVQVGIRGEDVHDTGDRDGSEEHPYSAADVRSGLSGDGVWVTGYIVGYASSSDASASAHFTADGANATNVLLADSADETDIANCIAVSLTSGEIRNALNLRDNPANLGQRLTIRGDLNSYLRIPGITVLTDYRLGE